MSIEIARIETWLFRAEVAEAVKTSFGSIPRRSVLLLRVEDTEGAYGWGEIWCNFPPFSADNKLRLMETVVAPAAFAAEYDDAAHAWHTLTEKTRRWTIQSGEYGPIAACIAGLDLALWDLQARRAALPLGRLLGAPANRNRVPAYASGLNPDSAVGTVQRARENGFSAFKVKIGFGLDKDIEVLKGLQRELRRGERLMVDVNQGWDMTQARRALPRLAEFNLGWVEEPIPANSSADEWAELAMISRTPIAGGENVSGFAAFSSLINQASHRVVQPDLLKWGGVTGCLAVGRHAVARGLTYCPHWLGSGIGLLASAHLLAAAGGDGLLEHDVMENPLREALATPFPRVENGTFALPDTPGLGVLPNLNEASGWLVNHQEFRG
ncbi:mandelate racemase/muconate lactonizing enzyme family protein [Paraburkholderia edwinii]|uniref:Mandelate racemase/muconate lactonizing enzyme family protein n=1 Tax=Paraburkholderia edwinii TaxID=2861782 RepID=A0ABX8UYA2_9BURK|nr:mandelate racemase/muconate lactonizing enzyme family protein [Paraburkholderia edwinii]QYD71964.1 mandelate racemase/muconate lactonizing enzyme family protein [Paraburkholderia edwinii]